MPLCAYKISRFGPANIHLLISGQYRLKLFCEGGGGGGRSVICPTLISQHQLTYVVHNIMVFLFCLVQKSRANLFFELFRTCSSQSSRAFLRAYKRNGRGGGSGCEVDARGKAGRETRNKEGTPPRERVIRGAKTTSSSPTGSYRKQQGRRKKRTNKPGLVNYSVCILL